MSQLQEMAKDREVWRAAARGLAESDTTERLNYIKCSALESPQSHPSLPIPPVCGKILFYETGPWCQKVWGPLFIILATMRTMVHSFRNFIHIFIYLIVPVTLNLNIIIQSMYKGRN